MTSREENILPASLTFWGKVFSHKEVLFNNFGLHVETSWAPSGNIRQVKTCYSCMLVFFFLIINNSNLQMNQLTTLLSSMFSLVIVIPSLVQSVDPNMILMSILEIRNNYELLAYM